MKTVKHLFMPSQTIHAIIKKVNQHNVNPLELQTLMIRFNELNNREVPRVGRTYAIPVLDRYDHLYRE